jgi:hypothetical protein
LQGSQDLVASHVGSDHALQLLNSGAVEPLALTQGDFHETGIPGLAVGYATSGGNVLVIHQGNLDAFAPQTRQAWEAIRDGNFPTPFLPEAEAFEIPGRPDFVEAGNFTGQGHVDLVTAARGQSTLYVFSGDGHGHFSSPTAINLPGAVTALAAGGFGQHSEFTSLLIGITGSKNSSLRLYRGSRSGLLAMGSFALPAPATQIQFGDLNGDTLSDAAVVSGDEILTLYSAPQGAQPTLKTASLPLQVAAVTLGRFVFDRGAQMQMALLASDGSIHIAVHSGLDSRPFTPSEVNLMMAHRGKANPLAAKPSAPGEGWTIVETFSGAVPAASNGQPILLRARISSRGQDDVVAVDALSGQGVVVSHPNLKQSSTSFEPGEMSALTALAGHPVAALVMRVNADARPGFVVLHQGKLLPTINMPLPDPTFTVNTTSDVIVANACANNVANSCSLREAVIEANATPGNDTIMVPAGTYQLTIPNNLLYNSTGGHLDIRDGVSIIGAGQNTTFIQAGTTNTNGIDKVFSIAAPALDGTLGPSFATAMSNFTCQFGQNTDTNDPVGGCLDGDAGSAGTGSLSLTNVTVQSNSAASSSSGSDDGGGIFFSSEITGQSGTVTISNSIFQGNSAQDDGGGIFIGLSVPLQMSNTQVLGNKAVGAGGQQGGGLVIFGASNNTTRSSILASLISGNQAGSQGGGVWTSQGILIDQGTIISVNNASGSGAPGGGLFTNPVNSEGTTVHNTTLTSNVASGTGGAIEVENSSSGTFAMTFSRITGNTATSGGSGINNISGNVTATDNWWGCNAGPSTAGDGCDQVAGAASLSPWVTLSHTPSPATILPGASTTLTASLLKDSQGNPIPPANLSPVFTVPSLPSPVPSGLPVPVAILFGNAVNGALSNAQTSIQSNGTATATFTAGSGGGTGHADATVDHATVTANITIQPDFSITITPPSQTVVLGNTASYNLTVTPLGGFTGVVNISNCGIAPSGPSLTGCPSSITITATSGPVSVTLNATTSTTNTAQNYTLSATGTSGALTHAATASLSATDFALSLTPSTQNIDLGSTASYTLTVTPLNGFVGTVTIGTCTLAPTPPSPSCPASVTITSTSGAVTNTITVPTTTANTAQNYTLNVGGSNSGQTRNASPATLVAQSFGLSISPISQNVLPGGTTTYTVTVTPLNGFCGTANTVTLSTSGLIAPRGKPSVASSVTFSPASITFSCSSPTAQNSTLTVVANTADAAQGDPFTVIGFVSSTLSASVNATLNVQDFSVTLTPSAQNVVVGSPTTYTLTVAPKGTNGFAGTVNITTCSLNPVVTNGPVLNGCPSSVTVNNAPVNTTLTATTGLTTPLQTYTINITGVAQSLSTLSHSTSSSLTTQDFQVTIAPASQTIVATQSSAPYTVTVTPLNSFSGTVNLSCVITPSSPGAPPTFSVCPSSVTISGAAVTFNVTLATTAATIGQAYTFTATGTAGGQSRSGTATLNVQNFTISVTPSSQNVLVGNSVSYILTVSSQGGFSGTVNIPTCSITPSVANGPTLTGCPGSLNVPAGGSASATLTASTTTATPAQNYAVNATGTSAAVPTLSQSASAGLIAQNFSVGITPATQTIVATQTSGPYTVTITPINGFTGTVATSCVVTPSGPGVPPTINLCPGSVTITGAAVSFNLTLATTAATTGQVYTLTATGTSAGQSRSGSATLSVQNFTISWSPTSQNVLLGNGVNYTLTVAPQNGFTGTVNISCSVAPSGPTFSCPASLTISGTNSVSANVPVNTTTSISAVNYTLSATGTSASVPTLQQTASATLVAQNFTVGISPSSQTILAGQTSGPYTVTVTPVNNFSGQIAINCSITPGGTGPFSCPSSVNVNGGPVSFSSSISTTTATPGQIYTLNATGTALGQPRSGTATLTVQNFGISISPSSQNVTPQSSAGYTVTVTSQGGFSGSVSLTCTGTLPEATIACNPTSVSVPAAGSASATLTASTSGLTPPGTFSVSVTGTGSGISQSASANATVIDSRVIVIGGSAPASILNTGSSATFTLSINGFAKTITYCDPDSLPFLACELPNGQGIQSNSTIAQALFNAFTSDSGSPVNMSLNGAELIVTSKTQNSMITFSSSDSAAGPSLSTEGWVASQIVSTLNSASFYITGLAGSNIFGTGGTATFTAGVNGFSKSVTYCDPTSSGIPACKLPNGTLINNGPTIMQALVNAFNADSSSPVNASLNSGLVTLTSKASTPTLLTITDLSDDAATSVSTIGFLGTQVFTTLNTAYLEVEGTPGPSVVGSGGTATFTVSVNGFSKSATYCDPLITGLPACKLPDGTVINNAPTIMQALVNAFNGDSTSPVNASITAAGLTLTAKTPGTQLTVLSSDDAAVGGDATAYGFLGIPVAP